MKLQNFLPILAASLKINLKKYKKSIPANEKN